MKKALRRYATLFIITALRHLKKSPYFIIAGVMVFTIAQPSYLMAIFNLLNPPKVAPLHSEEVLSSQPQPIGSFAPVSLGAPQMGMEDRLTEDNGNTVRQRLQELTDLRTAYTSTYQNDDGTKTMDFSTVQQNYRENGQWKKIDNKLESFSDSGKPGFRGDAGRAGASLRSLHSGISLAGGNDSIVIKPVGTGDIEPDKTGDYTVIYRDAWPGVDLKYELRGEMVKEYTIIKDKSAQTTFNYTVSGGQVIVDPNTEGALAVDGVEGYHFSPLTLDVNGRGVISEQRVTQTPTATGLKVSLDSEWFNSQPDSAFPMVIDPSWTSSDPNTTYKMYKSDGYYCPPTSCYANTGSINDGTWKHWRTLINFPYSALDNKYIITATMNGDYQSGAGGTTATKAIYMGEASCSNGFNCYGSQAGYDSSVSTDFSFSFKTRLQSLINANDFSTWWCFKGSEGSATSFKPYYMITASVTYDTPTPMATASTPANNSVITHTQPSLKVNAVDDVDSGDTEKYYFRVATGNDAETGAVINSGWITANQWTVPEHVLQDGTTYYWHVYTWGGNASAPDTDPNWVRSFKVDLRTGKDSTQAYDTVGPVDVDLATGNLTTSVQSHSISALGGDIGLNLDYNSPALSRPGLMGEYFDDVGFINQKLTRNDQNVDFDWGSGAPDPSMGGDYFSIRWTGYVTPPTSGNYQFGCLVNAGCTVSIDNVTVHSQSTTGEAYPTSSIYLEAGVPHKYVATMYEATGVANATMKYKLDGGTGTTIPSSWFSTEPQPFKQQYGLKGWYYNDPSATYAFPSNTYDPDRLMMVRDDSKISFNWAAGSASPGLPSDKFLVRWKGYLSVPESGTYKLGAYADDRVKIKLGIGAGGSDVTVLDSWVSGSYEVWGGDQSLTTGQKIPITVEFAEQTSNANFYLYVDPPSGAAQEMPVTWLTPQANILPNGWNLSVGIGDVRFEKLQAKQEAAVVSDSSGQTYEFTYDNTNGKYIPPVGEDAILKENHDGTYTLNDVDGSTYLFDAEGKLTSYVGPQDDKQPAALKYEYSGNPQKLHKIIDGVDSSRYGQLYYAGDSECVTGSGFDAAPDGMLCAFITTDGDETYFQYLNGNLARVETPGDAYEDFQYDSTYGRLVSYRDELANDAIAYSVRENDEEALTEIAYDDLGRASSVTAPAATASANRMEHTFSYVDSYFENGVDTGGATEMHITGASEPNGFIQRVEYDSKFRTTKNMDNAGLATETEWDTDKDLVLSTTDPLGLKSTTIYDDNDLPTDEYGPSPSSWFDTDRTPLTAYVDDVPHSETNYDEGIVGPDVSWYNYNATPTTSTSPDSGGSLLGAPRLHELGLSSSTGVLSADTASPAITQDSAFTGVGFRMTGKLTLPNGAYTIRAQSTDGIRIWVDGVRVLNSWQDASNRTVTGTAFTVANGDVKDLRVDAYFNDGATGDFKLEIQQTSGFTWTDDWSSWLGANYQLVTSEKSYDSVLSDTETEIEYSNPTYGLVSKSTIDPNGLDLENDATYEAPGSGYLRQTSRTMPGGTDYTYTYYGDTESIDNPCTVESDAVSQAGRIKMITEPDPDDTGSQTSRTTETVYNNAGDIVATRVNSDSWTCFTYDERGRQTESVIPTINGRTGRTVQTVHVVSGNPLVEQTIDSVAGTTEVTYDLLGRVVSAEDVWGNSYTMTFDDYGNVTQKVTPLGTEDFTYNNLYQLTSYDLDSTTLATITYDSYGRVDTVVYPEANDGVGDPLELTQVKHDSLERATGATYVTSDGETLDETVVLSQLGKVTGTTQTYDTQTLDSDYTYDDAGRLTSATVGETQFDYGYGAPDSTACSSNSDNNMSANLNSNRTSYTVTNTTTSSVVVDDKLCYNYADQLTYDSDVNIGEPTYDDHGNTTSFEGNGTALTFEYDADDYNTAVEQGTKRTEYVRNAEGGILRKKEFDSSALTTSYRYVAGGSVLQTCSLTNDDDCTTVDRYISLPGKVTLTLSPSNPDTDKQTVYSVHNDHGDTVLTLTGEGIAASGLDTLLGYGPFGEMLIAGTLGTNTEDPLNATDSTMGWAADPGRKQDERYTTTFVQMGARVYVPSLGRFLQIDPVEGGTANAYVYVSDPVNADDYSGEFAFIPLIMIAIRVIPVIVRVVQVIDKVAKAARIAAAAARAAQAAARAAQAARAAAQAALRAANAAKQAIIRAAQAPKYVTKAFKAKPAQAVKKSTAQQKYKSGMSRSNTVQNTTRVKSATSPQKYRIPDGLTNSTLTEVKNVQYQSWTSQLRDYSAIAQRDGLGFDLLINSSARLSGPLQQAFDKGLVNILRYQ